MYSQKVSPIFTEERLLFVLGGSGLLLQFNRLSIIPAVLSAVNCFYLFLYGRKYGKSRKAEFRKSIFMMFSFILTDIM